MTKPLLAWGAALAAALILFAFPAPARAAQPWWNVVTGSRPTNLPIAPDLSEVQELRIEEVSGGAAIEVAVNGETVGCLGAGAVGGITGSVFCEELAGFPAAENAAELREALEGTYGAVEVEGGPVDEAPFKVTTPGRWVPRIELTPIRFGGFDMGNASAEVISRDSGRLDVTFLNVGDAPIEGGSEPLSITDTLPSGAVAYGVESVGGYRGESGAVPCKIESVRIVHCSFEGTLFEYEAIEVEVLVALSDGAGAEAGEVTVAGGGASSLSASQRLNVSGAPVPFGIESFATQAEEEGGALSAQAGAHPFQLTSTIQLNSGALEGSRLPGHSPTIRQPAVPRNVGVRFPVGFVGSATATPTCKMADFLAHSASVGNLCAAETAVGVASAAIIEGTAFPFARVTAPIFNLTPEQGEPARFGFLVAGAPVLIDTSVNPEDSYRITGEVRNVTQVATFLSSSITLWGTPGDPRHNASRGWNCIQGGHFNEEECISPPDLKPTPFLRQPVSCVSPLHYDAALEPWNVALGADVERAVDSGSPLAGCNKVPFDPHVSNAFTSKLASNPSGLDFELDLSNSGLESSVPGAIAEAQPKKITVTLPEGVTVNPSEAEGLATCTPADYRRETASSAPGDGCPQASKIGNVTASTPLLEEEAHGALYLATPYENPSATLLALYLVAKIPARGIVVKQAGEVTPDPSTGQLVTTFDNLPQLPYSSFKLHFREGARAPLITPPGCGAFATTARFVPWSAADPDNPAPAEVVERRASFTIDHGVNGGACPQGPATFHPGFEAGTLNNQAGSYSAFVMHLTRNDGEQDMGKFSFVLPPGVVGKLAGIPYCPEAGIARAQGRQGPHGGQEELNDPSCPAASQIGTTVGGAGVGNQLTYVKGKLYLAGPWHGDPLSVVAITPAVAGPFDAGDVVVREALRLNPLTARAEVDGAASDPIPHILKGIPLNLRDLRVYADKPDFTLNATSCEPFKAESTIWGDGTALEPAGETPVGLGSRYQAAGCASLGFKPKLGIKLKGGTKRGKFPALHATYTPRPGDANLSRLALTFPHSEFIEQGHFGTICTRVQFAAGAGDGSACPPASVYGHVRAWSPLLAQPLEGPVYLRSSSHNLPDAVFALHGLVNIDVVVRIDSSHGGLRATVEGAPDAPVSRAIVDMQGGKKGLFVNSTNLCAAKHRAKANATAQNGKRDQSKPLVRVKCGKAHHKRRSHR